MLTNKILQIVDTGVYRWYELDVNSGDLLHTTSYHDLAELPPVDHGERLIILLPGKEIFLTHIVAPKTTRQNILKALPFLLEDKVAVDVDTLHIVANRMDQDVYCVAAMNKNKFERHLEKIKLHHLRPEAIIPDYFSLPFIDSAWSLKVEQESVIVRQGKYSGFASTQDHLPLMLRLKRQEEKIHQAVDCRLFLPENTTCVVADLSGHLGEDFVLRLDQNSRCFSEDLFKQKPAINFLQGPYQIKQRKAAQQSCWDYVKYAAVACLALFLIGKITLWVDYHQQNKKVMNKLMAIAQQVSPGITDVGDLKPWLERKMHTLRNSGGDKRLTDLLARLGAALQQASGVELRHLNFQDNKLSLSLSAQRLVNLENFSKQLAANKVKILQNQVSAGEKTVSSELIIEAL